MEHAGKCPVMTGDFSPPDTERNLISVMNLDKPTKPTYLDCDTKIKDTIQTVLSISKAQEMLSELKREIEEAQDHQFSRHLLILGEPFSIRFIIEPDRKTPEKLNESVDEKITLSNQDDTPLFEVD
jgi:hypothetical protein